MHFNAEVKTVQTSAAYNVTLKRKRQAIDAASNRGRTYAANIATNTACSTRNYADIVKLVPRQKFNISLSKLSIIWNKYKVPPRR